MHIDQLLVQAKSIWKNEKLELKDILIRLGKVYGDVCRWERNAPKDAATHTDDELKKELGNIIFSTIRWCDDLGYDPKECIERAIRCQHEFQKLSCATHLEARVISQEVFDREIALCKKLSYEKGGGCGWGRCEQCGVVALLYKLHKGILLEGEELAKIKNTLFSNMDQKMQD